MNHRGPNFGPLFLYTDAEIIFKIHIHKLNFVV